VLLVEGTDAADAICQTAARLGVDLVCVGAHGRSGLGRLVTGSVTQAVLARSPRPVLVVPEPRPG
jgi:nucleotide-binding universal stress UspA family protein